MKIKTSLLISFSILICMTLFLSIFLMVMYSNIESRYSIITDNMVAEYRITESFSKMIDSYTALLQDVDNDTNRQEYEAAGREIEDIFIQLDDSAVFPETKDQYIRLKNMVRSIKSECDDGLVGLSGKNFTQGVGVYDRAIRGDAYVRENTANLVLKQLEYGKILQKQMESLRLWTLISSLVLILLIIVGSTILAILYSNSVSNPLMKLSNIANDISRGNLEISVYPSLLARKDEIGSLSNSLNEMLKRLNTEIATQKEINVHLTDARKQLESINLELSKKDVVLVEVNKQMEVTNQQLEVANQKLTDLDKKKDEFISVAAHELKTPLTSIKGFAQLMKNEAIMNDKEKREHYLTLINSNTVRLYNLILDIVDISRLNLGQLTLNLQETDVSVIMQEMIENMEVIIKEKGITPIFNLENDLPRITVDIERLLQVIRNLLTNAIHFTTKGQIELHIYRKANDIIFEVKDTGEGIPLDKQRDIFSRFYQADQSLTRKVQGSGLGLSICKGLVELMGGKIWFNSVPGQETTFAFNIPITPPIAAPDAKPVPSPFTAPPVPVSETLLADPAPSAEPGSVHETPAPTIPVSKGEIYEE